MKGILAIDQGTTSTRAFSLDKNQQMHLVHTVLHRQIYPRTGWVEHDPRELITSIEDCLTAAQLTGHFDVVGIDNQGESCLAWDKNTLEALSPVIVWQDNRTHQTIEELKHKGAQELTLQKAGLPLDCYFSASKMRWMLENLPEVQSAARTGRLCLGTTDAYFRHWFCGRFETDATTASRTSLLNIKTLSWDNDLCELFGVPQEYLPSITPCVGELGEFSQSAGKKILGASIVDQQSALYGHGCTTHGATKITFGTGAFVLSISDNALSIRGGECIPTVAMQRKNQQAVYALDGGVYAAGSAINWAKSLGLINSFDELMQINKAPAIERGIVFVPALAGLGCPFWDRNAKGAWLGLNLSVDSVDLMQAVMEGIAFRTSQVLRTMKSLSHDSPPISIDGGLVKNPWFCQTLSNVIYHPVSTLTETEVTAFGVIKLCSDLTKDNIEKLDMNTIYEPNQPLCKFSEYYDSITESIQSVGKLQIEP